MNLQGCFLASFWGEWTAGKLCISYKIGNNNNNNNHNHNHNHNHNDDKTNSSLDLLDEKSPFQQEHHTFPTLNS